MSQQARKRKYRGKAETEGWYLLTNLEDLQQSITAFKCQSGIEAMFKDCKTGGYNLERTQASDERLNNLILLIALAYSCAILQGQQIKRKGIQKYIGRLKEAKRSQRRHSSFWIELYGQSWVIGIEFFQEIVNELMRITGIFSTQKNLPLISRVISYSLSHQSFLPITTHDHCRFS